MRHILRLTAALTLAAALASPAWACPLCKEAAESAVDSTSEQEFTDDPLAEAKAYNRNIYVMIGVPYAIFAVGGVYCYRHLRGRAGASAAQ